LASSAGKSEGPASQGALFFGDFLLGKQKKVTSRRAAPGDFDLVFSLKVIAKHTSGG